MTKLKLMKVEIVIIAKIPIFSCKIGVFLSDEAREKPLCCINLTRQILYDILK